MVDKQIEKTSADAEINRDDIKSESTAFIRTERLFIRRVVVGEDADGIFAIRSRMNVMKWSSAKTPDADVAATKNHFLNLEQKGALNLVIFEGSNTSRVIGTIGFFKRDGQHGQTELGYLLHPDFWGKGFTTEAVRAAINFWWDYVSVVPGNSADDTNGLSKSDTVLRAVTDTLNLASHRVLEKCGFKRTAATADEKGPDLTWELHKNYTSTIGEDDGVTGTVD
ncbi:uncharacterized protein PADG_01130 [Paracoccidioides brasiliensis Pb18]|uniref:N-acetyltransferase domain-containing protein n=1 Tax=Paracoccidioides brasiliensis (strain Pb18) TaxID=502780 RepID=C1FZA4_PARBD|nr:uncharacterized protein PADG_01130 [Paracoccidioides brasiliensis Pb18]EEH44841.1 hypothetical protein PADG_01130 [Paracoccidioides brasiliensis Pb18]ODH49151.1 hypothetical protein GX48_04769 [Paracoccidioides brasiliensis]